MTKYRDEEERAIRTERSLNEWTQSGLLEKAQHARMLPELQHGLRRTNVFLRATLFGFGLMIITALLLLIGVTFRLRVEHQVAVLCFFGAAASVALAESLISTFRLYRFGIEEAAAVAGAAFLAVGAGFLVATRTGTPFELPLFVALVTGAIAGFAVYLRYGYVYAAIAAMLCLIFTPTATELSRPMQHAVSAGLLVPVLVFARLKRQHCPDEFRGDRYGFIQAAAWLGIYACLNLRLPGWFSPLVESAMTGRFYWLTYAGIWLIPALGLFLGLRHRDRPLLDVSILLSLATLATNKPYLGLARQTWDPILLGLLLIGIAVVAKRWLSIKDRKGLTSERILLSDRREIALAATAQAWLQTSHPMPASESQDFKGGGGRSGGAGASGSF